MECRLSPLPRDVSLTSIREQSEGWRKACCEKSAEVMECLMESSRKYLEHNLNLTLNLEKSKAISIYSMKFKFLGFAFGNNGKETPIRVYKDSLAKAKVKLKELTRRNQGKNVREVMEKVKVYIRG